MVKEISLYESLSFSWSLVLRWCIHHPSPDPYCPCQDVSKFGLNTEIMWIQGHFRLRVLTEP